MYRFPWYLTLVSTNHALSNPGLVDIVVFNVRKKELKNLRIEQTSKLFANRSLAFCPADIF